MKYSQYHRGGHETEMFVALVEQLSSGNLAKTHRPERNPSAGLLARALGRFNRISVEVAEPAVAPAAEQALTEHDVALLLSPLKKIPQEDLLRRKLQQLFSGDRAQDNFKQLVRLMPKTQHSWQNLILFVMRDPTLKELFFTRFANDLLTQAQWLELTAQQITHLRIAFYHAFFAADGGMFEQDVVPFAKWITPTDRRELAAVPEIAWVMNFIDINKPAELAMLDPDGTGEFFKILNRPDFKAMFALQFLLRFPARWEHVSANLEAGQQVDHRYQAAAAAALPLLQQLFEQDTPEAAVNFIIRNMPTTPQAYQALVTLILKDRSNQNLFFQPRVTINQETKDRVEVPSFAQQLLDGTLLRDERGAMLTEAQQEDFADAFFKVVYYKRPLISSPFARDDSSISVADENRQKLRYTTSNLVRVMKYVDLRERHLLGYDVFVDPIAPKPEPGAVAGAAAASEEEKSDKKNPKDHALAALALIYYPSEFARVKTQFKDVTDDQVLCNICGTTVKVDNTNRKRSDSAITLIDRDGVSVYEVDAVVAFNFILRTMPKTQQTCQHFMQLVLHRPRLKTLFFSQHPQFTQRLLSGEILRDQQGLAVLTQAEQAMLTREFFAAFFATPKSSNDQEVSFATWSLRSRDFKFTPAMLKNMSNYLNLADERVRARLGLGDIFIEVLKRRYEQLAAAGHVAELGYQASGLEAKEAEQQAIVAKWENYELALFLFEKYPDEWERVRQRIKIASEQTNQVPPQRLKTIRGESSEVFADRDILDVVEDEVIKRNADLADLKEQADLLQLTLDENLAELIHQLILFPQIVEGTNYITLINTLVKRYLEAPATDNIEPLWSMVEKTINDAIKESGAKNKQAVAQFLKAQIKFAVLAHCEQLSLRDACKKLRACHDSDFLQHLVARFELACMDLARLPRIVEQERNSRLAELVKLWNVYPLLRDKVGKRLADEVVKLSAANKENLIKAYPYFETELNAGEARKAVEARKVAEKAGKDAMAIIDKRAVNVPEAIAARDFTVAAVSPPEDAPHAAPALATAAAAAEAGAAPLETKSSPPPAQAATADHATAAKKKVKKLSPQQQLLAAESQVVEHLRKLIGDNLDAGLGLCNRHRWLLNNPRICALVINAVVNYPQQDRDYFTRMGNDYEFLKVLPGYAQAVEERVLKVAREEILDIPAARRRKNSKPASAAAAAAAPVVSTATEKKPAGKERHLRGVIHDLEVAIHDLHERGYHSERKRKEVKEKEAKAEAHQAKSLADITAELGQRRATIQKTRGDLEALKGDAAREIDTLKRNVKEASAQHDKAVEDHAVAIGFKKGAAKKGAADAKDEDVTKTSNQGTHEELSRRCGESIAEIMQDLAAILPMLPRQQPVAAASAEQPQRDSETSFVQSLMHRLNTLMSSRDQPVAAASVEQPQRDNDIPFVRFVKHHLKTLMSLYPEEQHVFVDLPRRFLPAKEQTPVEHQSSGVAASAEPVFITAPPPQQQKFTAQALRGRVESATMVAERAREDLERAKRALERKKHIDLLAVQVELAQLKLLIAEQKLKTAEVCLAQKHGQLEEELVGLLREMEKLEHAENSARIDANVRDEEKFYLALQDQYLQLGEPMSDEEKKHRAHDLLHVVYLTHRERSHNYHCPDLLEDEGFVALLIEALLAVSPVDLRQLAEIYPDFFRLEKVQEALTIRAERSRLVQVLGAPVETVLEGDDAQKAVSAFSKNMLAFFQEEPITDILQLVTQPESGWILDHVLVLSSWRGSVAQMIIGRILAQPEVERKQLQAAYPGFFQRDDVKSAMLKHSDGVKRRLTEILDQIAGLDQTELDRQIGLRDGAESGQEKGVIIIAEILERLFELLENEPSLRQNNSNHQTKQQQDWLMIFDLVLKRNGFILLQLSQQQPALLNHPIYIWCVWQALLLNNYSLAVWRELVKEYVWLKEIGNVRENFHQKVNAMSLVEYCQQLPKGDALAEAFDVRELGCLGEKCRKQLKPCSDAAAAQASPQLEEIKMSQPELDALLASVYSEREALLGVEEFEKVLILAVLQQDAQCCAELKRRYPAFFKRENFVLALRDEFNRVGNYEKLFLVPPDVEVEVGHRLATPLAVCRAIRTPNLGDLIMVMREHSEVITNPTFINILRQLKPSTDKTSNAKLNHKEWVSYLISVAEKHSDYQSLAVGSVFALREALTMSEFCVWKASLKEHAWLWNSAEYKQAELSYSQRQAWLVACSWSRPPVQQGAAVAGAAAGEINSKSSERDALVSAYHQARSSR